MWRRSVLRMVRIRVIWAGRAASSRAGCAIRPAGSGTGSDLARVVLAAEADRGHPRVDRVATANDRADAGIDRQDALTDRMAAASHRTSTSDQKQP